MQTERLERTRKAIEKKFREEIDSIRTTKYFPKSGKQDFSLIRLYCDYHFYFTCIGQINKLLKRLVEELKDPNLKSVYDKFKKIFKKDIRDDLEHIDERVIGKKGKNNIKPISDWGNFFGDIFSFAGREYTVNRKKLKQLTQIYDEAIDVLYKNCAGKDPNFIYMEQRERQSELLFRHLKKIGII